MPRHLNRLIEIFYGLAIAEGLARAIPDLLDDDVFNFKKLGFVGSALLIGIADWLAYHLFIASAAYKGIMRLLFDLGFPMLVFLLFAAAGHPFVEASAICVYFYCALVYFSLLRKEGVASPPEIVPVVFICLTLDIAVMIIDTLWHRGMTYFTELSALITACIAAVLTLRHVQVALENESALRLVDVPQGASGSAGGNARELGRPLDVVSLLGAIFALLIIVREGFRGEPQTRRPTRGLKRTPDGAA
jgi:hypothetical protein